MLGCRNVNALLVLLLSFCFYKAILAQGRGYDPVWLGASRLADQLEKVFTPKEATVVRVVEEWVYLNVGGQDGVVRGMEFEVVKQGAEVKDVVTGLVLGREEVPVGRVRVVSPRSKMSIAIVETAHGGRAPAEGDKAYSVVNVPVLAVTNFVGANEERYQLGADLSDLLTMELLKRPRFHKVVERKLLSRVMNELKLTESGLIHPQSVKELGKAVSADAIVTGSITVLGSTVAVNARVIEAETALIIGSVGTSLPKAREVIDKLVELPRWRASRTKPVETPTDSKRRPKVTTTQNPNNIILLYPALLPPPFYWDRLNSLWWDIMERFWYNYTLFPRRWRYVYVYDYDELFCPRAFSRSGMVRSKPIGWP